MFEPDTGSQDKVEQGRQQVDQNQNGSLIQRPLSPTPNKSSGLIA